MRLRDIKNNTNPKYEKPVNALDGLMHRELPKMDKPYQPTVSQEVIIQQQARRKRIYRPKYFLSKIKGVNHRVVIEVYRKLADLSTARGLGFRVITACIAMLMFATFILEVTQPKISAQTYDVTNYEGSLLKRPITTYGEKLKQDPKTGKFIYNADYKPGADVAGQSYAPKINANFDAIGDRKRTITDPQKKVSITLKPEYKTLDGQKYKNRMVYPLVGKNGKVVYTLNGSSVKEDIILNKYQADELSFEYEVSLSDGLETRLEKDGSLGVYGVQASLLGDVKTGTENDAKLLEKARKSGNKTDLIFKIPAPVVLEGLKKKSNQASSYYEVRGNKLIIHTTGLKEAKYPLSIDPSVYVETASKLMRGNNETNTDFDIDDELIQKSQTTGARIDAWEGNLDMDEGTWDQSTAAAGGYIYRSGGRTGITKPTIVAQQTTTDSTDGTTFQMAMPTSRPAGDLYIALMCHDGTVTMTPPAGWTEYADTREHAAFYKVGTDQGGGNESANYTWTGSGSETFAGVIIRVTGFNSSDPVSGTAGTGSSGSDAVPQFPATTPDGPATLVVRAVGIDADIPSVNDWVPSGHTKIASGTSGGTACGFASASLDTPPATGVSTGTASLGEMSDTYGASSIAINPADATTPPIIQGTQSSTDNTDGASFQMNMPATRPAGDLYIALMCHDGDVRVNAPGGGGWTEFADTREHAAYYKIGDDVSGGQEAASYTWNLASGTETFAGVIIRVSGFNSSDIVSGTAGTGSSGSNATPVYPATTPDTNKTLVIRSTGIDDDVPSATAWLPANHTKIDSSTSGGGNDCGFTSAALNNAPVSGVSTGTATLGEMSDTYGASSIAINAATTSSPESALSTLEWAKFNSSTLEIESPNPGNGVCSGWCTESTYNLPSSRRGHSMVAYNGYLYVIGGVDGSGNRVSTVYIAKIGSNGEPQLWHPTDPDKSNWDYWYEDSGLSSGTARSYLTATAYNNRMYIMGGQTDASTGGTTTSEYADIKPNGTLGSWTSATVLPNARHGHTVHMYNDKIYLIGGNSSGTLQNTTHYATISSTGSLNSWQSTSSFTTARSTWGGSYSTVWGAYIYLSGGCTAVNGSGYCTSQASDTQIASINADGSLAPWGSINNLTNQRIGYNIIGWQGGLYRLGGCTDQDASTGKCLSTLADVDYGVINPAGEVSTVDISVPSGSAPCSGGSPYSCDLPPPGDDAGEGGQLLTMTTVLNGYLYVLGGCIDYNCDGTNPASDDYDTTGNISYVSIDSEGRLTKPSACGGTSYGAWCVDSTNKLNNTGSNQTDGIAAAGVTTFNNRIYIVGGTTGNGLTTNIYYNSVNTDGSLAGAWSTVDMTTAGIAEDVAYTYAYARANPEFAGTNPGNLFLFGGCGSMAAAAGCNNDYETEVYKCNITTSGSISGCSTSGQLQIDSTPGSGGTDGLGLHSGTVNANYIYLIGGYSGAEADKDDVLYAKFDNSNNVVAVSGSDWIESPNKLSVGRRRGFSFGFNGHIYSVGGYDAGGGGVNGVIPFIEWSKMNVSDGSIDPFVTSSIKINQRWGLSMIVSNSYAYVVGGCDVGASPDGCTSFEDSVQTFQLYNNDSGAVNNYTSQSDQEFATDTNRIGASSAIYNGYLYVAGGCTDIACSAVSDNVQYAQIDASNGSIGNWSNTTDATLPGGRAWGGLEVAGGTLYYAGGQDSGGDEKSDVYYGTPISGDISAWALASNGLPADRSQHGTAVWNNRLYVVGGLDDSAAVTNTVYVSPQLNSGGDIGSAWSSTTAFTVARTGAAVTAYANNLYLFGGVDISTNYLNDSQITQINSDGTVDSWSYSTSLPVALRDARAFSANGYIYVVGGRTAATTCRPISLVTPISANTTIASGNNPTGIGEWYETNVRYSGDRYGAAVAYEKGQFYTMGGGCSSVLSTNRHYQSTVKSQPQVAIYSRLIDTDIDVFPTKWLLNGLDNSIGARWQLKYRSMNDTDGVATDCGSADMTTWGEETNVGDVTLGTPGTYTPKDGGGNNINCARYFYFFINIDASKTFGYPEDVNRGPTISDLSLFFTSDPSRRMRHGKTFNDGAQQPFDTPFP